MRIFVFLSVYLLAQIALVVACYYGVFPWFLFEPGAVLIAMILIAIDYFLMQEPDAEALDDTVLDEYYEALK